MASHTGDQQQSPLDDNDNEDVDIQPDNESDNEEMAPRAFLEHLIRALDQNDDGFMEDIEVSFDRNGHDHGEDDEDDDEDNGGGNDDDEDEDEDDDDDGEYVDNEDGEQDEDLESGPAQARGQRSRVLHIGIEMPNRGGSVEPGQGALRSFLRLLRYSQNGRRMVIPIDDDEEGDEDEAISHLFRRRRRERRDPGRFPKVPSDEGAELMRSGTFGVNVAEPQRQSDSTISRKKRLARMILDRELASYEPPRQRVNNRVMSQGLLPSSKADMIIHFNEPVYSGQFSEDGTFFFSANKDFKVRMYDTSNPYEWRYYKTVNYPFGQWTLTDASLSPDNRYLAYTSIRSLVCLAPTNPNDMGDPYVLNLADFGSDPADRSNYLSADARSFAIWSIRFSGDGRELVAGTTGGSIVVYDIESRRSLHRIFGHEDDVNAVCFADSSSPHILYSGSDDKTIKVWDTRSLRDRREAGAFVGHIEGITYIDSKGDGRYVLSNGKEQSMKLWDLRMVMSPKDFGAIKSKVQANPDEDRFDYRWGAYDEDDWYRHPNDNSLVTFRGHSVLRTLIRCHFSPPGSSDSRYVYSGSEDGKVYIWNLDATLAGTIDVSKETRTPGARVRRYHGDFFNSEWRTCVRDASWHPNVPMIVASAWAGYGMSSGTCSVHSWNDETSDDEGEPKMGYHVNQILQRDHSL
ncbi:WD40-repeat-containing domain protein [Xylogone sp. PMI_703]|nr:WD40-repeat-containing domain protein [Xylogone sp. PMI_703]